MAKTLLSAATEEALSIVAHAQMADSIAKNVEGMADFGRFYRVRRTHREQKIMSRFEAMCRKAKQDLATMLEQDLP